MDTRSAKIAELFSHPTSPTVSEECGEVGSGLCFRRAGRVAQSWPANGAVAAGADLPTPVARVRPLNRLRGAVDNLVAPVRVGNAATNGAALIGE